MKIPGTGDPVGRHGLFQELIDQCFVSQSNRVTSYQNLWSYYLWGSNTDAIPVLSKIYGHLDTVTSFLYSADTTRFKYELGAAAPDSELEKIPKLKEHFTQTWRNSHADIMFGEQLTNALIFNTMIMMPDWKAGRGLQMYVIQPHNFGVLREDLTGLDNQEAVAFEYQITRSQLENNLADHPRKAEILSKVIVGGSKPTQSDALPPAVENIIASQVTPNIVGQAVWWANPQIFYQPMIGVDMVTMQDLWVWDDSDADYRRVTMSEGVVVYDRPNTFLPRVGNEERGQLPFVQIAPNPMTGYFWGRSEILQLLKLQDAWAHRLNQIIRLNDKVTDPPKMAFGVNAEWDEISAALNSPGGGYSQGDTMPGAKIENMAPTIPESVWHEMDYLDRLYLEASGISPIMKGQGESGVRSRGQTDTLARLGSSRTKKRALIVEASLDELATKVSQLIRRNDPTRLPFGKPGEKFVASQFTSDHTVKVDAHSQSPVFIEDEKELAFSLLEARAIDRETLLEMTHPGNEQMLHTRLKKMMAQEAEQQRVQQAMAEQETKLKAVK